MTLCHASPKQFSDVISRPMIIHDRLCLYEFIRGEGSSYSMLKYISYQHLFNEEITTITSTGRYKCIVQFTGALLFRQCYKKLTGKLFEFAIELLWISLHLFLANALFHYSQWIELLPRYISTAWASTDWLTDFAFCDLKLLLKMQSWICECQNLNISSRNFFGK